MIYLWRLPSLFVEVWLNLINVVSNNIYLVLR